MIISTSMATWSSVALTNPWLRTPYAKGNQCQRPTSIGTVCIANRIKQTFSKQKGKLHLRTKHQLKLTHDLLHSNGHMIFTDTEKSTVQGVAGIYLICGDARCRVIFDIPIHTQI